MGILAWHLPREARGDGEAAYQYEDYREAGGRIAVREQSGSLAQDLAEGVNLKLTGTLDAIAGATPTGQPAAPGSGQVPLANLTERRKEWTGDLTGSWADFSVDAGFADSRESDYVSAGWSLNTHTEFNQRNTDLLVGVAGTSDRVEVFFEPAYLPKHTADGVVGLTQVLDPLTYVALNLTWGRAAGYLGEQHKLVEKTIQVLPGIFLPESFGENRPGEKDHGAAKLTLDRAFPALRGSLEASYRFYRDTFGISGQTGEVSWYQHLGARLLLRPLLRGYDQTAAHFYYYNLDQTAIVPVRLPNGRGPYYSSDYRISALASWSAGLKAVWTLNAHCSLDLAFERYQMRGRDGVTPQSAYPLAAITTAGARFTW
jgi:hypothetical protein